MLLHSFNLEPSGEKFKTCNNRFVAITLIGPYLTDAIMGLTSVYMDHVFNQGYHVSFNGLLGQTVFSAGL